MHLLGTTTSPYTRKVRIVAIELGLGSEMTFEAIKLTSPPEELEANPLGRVPTLLRDDGTALFDSPVITEWLDAEFGGNRLLPATGPERWTIRVAEALGDGLTDSAVAIRHEMQRPEDKRSEETIDKNIHKVDRALALIDTEPEWLKTPVNLGQIAVAAAIGYIGFRLPHLLEAPRPRLHAWYETFAARPSMVETAPA